MLAGNSARKPARKIGARNSQARAPQLLSAPLICIVLKKCVCILELISCKLADVHIDLSIIQALHYPKMIVLDSVIKCSSFKMRTLIHLSENQYFKVHSTFSACPSLSETFKSSYTILESSISFCTLGCAGTSSVKQAGLCCRIFGHTVNPEIVYWENLFLLVV